MYIYAKYKSGQPKTRKKGKREKWKKWKKGKLIQ